jgi:hypothetical protein
MNRYFVLLIHLVYWSLHLLLLLLIFALVAGASQHQQNTAHFFRLWTLVSISFAIIPGLITFYASYFFLFDRFFKPGKIRALFGVGSLVLLGSILTGLICGHFLFDRQVISIQNPEALLSQSLFIGFVAFINGSIGLMIRGFVSTYIYIRKSDQLLQKNKQMELELIKSQLDPHFLFNTINNIDTLIAADPEKASRYLNELSSILRVVLYSNKEEKVSLEKECLTIQKYVDLQRIRYQNPKHSKLDIELEHPDYLIYPMVLLPFIENAFKHCSDKKSDHAILISIRESSGILHFVCSNRFNSQIISSINEGGIGDNLAKKRLVLLYGNECNMHVSKTETHYEFHLTIRL